MEKLEKVHEVHCLDIKRKGDEYSDSFYLTTTPNGRVRLASLGEDGRIRLPWFDSQAELLLLSGGDSKSPVPVWSD